MKNTLKKVTASVVTLMFAIGLSLVAVNSASAGQDEAFYNQESNYPINATEVCQKFTPPTGTTTWSLPSNELPAGDVWTKVIIKSGSTDAQQGRNGAANYGYYTNSAYINPAASTDLTWTHVADLAAMTFSHPNLDKVLHDISHVIYCYAPAPLTDVAGSASSTNEVCTEGALNGGVITVKVTTGVVYEIKNSSNTVVPFDAVTGATSTLPSGAYTVQVSAASGYHLT
ncbi:MAG: hypothetical protein H7279_06245, partial [Microbacteriaceae bacterium]|nr:hypothetical protein [Microbacteriaceae bacterium]